MSMNILYKKLKQGHIVRLKTVDQMMHLGYKWKWVDGKLLLVDSHDFYINSDLIPLLGTNQKVLSLEEKYNDMYFIKLAGNSSSFLVCEAIDRVIGFDGDEEKYVISKDLDFDVGEIVLVSDSNWGWVKRTFVSYCGVTGKYICVLAGNEDYFLSGRNFYSQQWCNIKKYKIEERKKKKKVLKAPAIYRNTVGPYITDTLYGSEAEARGNGTKSVFIKWPATLMLGNTSTPMWVEVEE